MADRCLFSAGVWFVSWEGFIQTSLRVTIKLASTALRIWSNYFPWTVFFPGYVALSCTIASEKKKKLSILSKIYETFFFFFSLIVLFSKVGRAEQPEVFKVWGHFGCASDMMVLCLIHFSLLIVPGHCRTLWWHFSWAVYHIPEFLILVGNGHLRAWYLMYEERFFFLMCLSFS